MLFFLLYEVDHLIISLLDIRSKIICSARVSCRSDFDGVTGAGAANDFILSGNNNYLVHIQKMIQYRLSIIFLKTYTKEFHMFNYDYLAYS